MNSPDTVMILLFVSFFICIFGVIFFLFSLYASRHSVVETRIQDIHEAMQRQDYRALSIAKKRRDWEKFEFLSRAPGWINLPLLFEQAGLYDDIGKWVLLSLCGTGVAGSVLYYFTQNALLSLLIGVLAFAGIPYLYLIVRRRNRIREFDAQLAPALEIVSRSLKAGHPFLTGMQMVSSEMPDPISSEIAIVLQEHQLGVPLEDALVDLSHRVPLVDLRMFVLSLMIHKTVGGDLAEVLDNLAKVIRERFRILGQVKALTAEGRLSGWILCALPPFIFLVLTLLNPHYIEILLATDVGHQMVYAALILQVMGMIVIRKIVNIKV